MIKEMKEHLYDLIEEMPNDPNKVIKFFFDEYEDEMFPDCDEDEIPLTPDELRDEAIESLNFRLLDLYNNLNLNKDLTVDINKIESVCEELEIKGLSDILKELV